MFVHDAGELAAVHVCVCEGGRRATLVEESSTEEKLGKAVTYGSGIELSLFGSVSLSFCYLTISLSFSPSFYLYFGGKCGHARKQFEIKEYRSFSYKVLLTNVTFRFLFLHRKRHNEGFRRQLNLSEA